MYCTLADLQAAVGQAQTLRFFDDDNDGVEDTAAVNSVLSRVASQIDARLTRVYNMAAVRANPPATLQEIATDLALQLMGERRPDFADGQGRSPYFDRGKRAMDLLKDIQKGDARLDIDGSPSEPANVSAGGIFVPSSSSDSDAPSTTDGFVRNGTGFFL